jgi:ribonucleoside-triphosphate reductase
MTQSVRSEIVTRRTYSRPKEDGTFETWEDIVNRVIDHQRWLWERAKTHKLHRNIPLHDLSEDMIEWKKLSEEEEYELWELWEAIYQRTLLPAGRTLWLGGTEVSRRRESSMFNCSHTNVETVYDLVDILWLLLQGCGVGFTPIVGTLTGFRKPIPNIEIIKSNRTGKGGRETNDESFVNGIWTISLGDSAEAWAKSIGKLVAGKFPAHTLRFDFREIRPAGERLKGYGWISSGDEAISVAFPAIAKILNKRAGNLLRKIDILDIVNWLGTILSSRRSAEIALCEYGSPEWKDFAYAKQDCWANGNGHRQQSNNSLVFFQRPSKEQLSEVFAIMADAGGSEPGIINGQAALHRAPWFKGVNPCAEILLGNKSFCNLVEVDIAKFKGDAAGLHRAITLTARCNYRQTVVDFRDGVLQESWHLNNEFLRLCGVGVTGIAQRDDIDEYEWKNLKYSAVHAARQMAQELDLEHPKNVTTVKPSGTVSKIMDTTEGVHKPLGKYIFNWINFSKEDPMLTKLMEANFKIIENPNDPTGKIVCIPIKYDHIEFDIVDGVEVNLDSATKQLDRYKQIQLNYCDQNVSNTVSYDLNEVPNIINWLYDNWDCYVGVSFIYRNDPTKTAEDLGYLYLPQEVVDEKTYNTYEKSLVPINWNETGSTIELIEDECATGACPIK